MFLATPHHAVLTIPLSATSSESSFMDVLNLMTTDHWSNSNASISEFSLDWY